MGRKIQNHLHTHFVMFKPNSFYLNLVAEFRINVQTNEHWFCQSWKNEDIAKKTDLKPNPDGCM